MNLDPQEMKLRKLDQVWIRLRSVEAVSGTGDKTMRQQLALSFALIVAACGEGRLMVDQETVELENGSAYVCVPGQTFGTVDLSEDGELIAFYFDAYADSNSVGEEAGGKEDGQLDALLPYHGKLRVHTPGKLAVMAESACRAWQHGEPMGHFRSQIDLQEMLYYLYRNSRTKPYHAGEALEAAKRYIDQHYNEPVTIEQLARVAELSPKYFAEMYKKKYGKSPIEYVTEKRMQRAKQLMATASAKLREIAHQTGYADEFYFSRKFKQEIGVSPSVYMRSRRRKLAAYSPSVLGFLTPLGFMPYAAAMHPKWTEYYYREFRSDIPLHISAYRYNEDWRENLERLRQAPIDLILAVDSISEEEQRALEQMAPVQILAASQTEWRELLMQVAEEINESWQANQWLRAYEFRLEQVKERLPQSLRQETLVIVRMKEDRLFLHCNRGMAGLLFDDLGLAPGYVCDTPCYNCPITLEELGRIDPGYLLMMIRQDSETLEAWGRLQVNPSWQAIRAVQRRRVKLLSSDPWLEYSAHAHLRMLDQFTELFPEENP
ncbi:AraC family transcriptional regulator [Paenibacillus phoenicis]|uniref:AraC family transcriptional regulator n=1 Tax=Paenibacillus phoenicis TaxID=554117 RepID=A0ABU5PHU0_9BACL|nr:helix-turn-helix domain-containing protein [Paenibacillus phoenicis]MEA3569476.1 AraC family transcriptional regulator [Paenibacillus phoenicis]